MNTPGSNKTVRELILVTSEYLDGKGIDSARLNTERLLADVLGLARIELYFQHDRPVLGPELDDLISTLRPDFDFFGKKNIFTSPKKPAEPKDQEKSGEGKDKESIEIVDEDENPDDKTSDDKKTPESE